MAILDKFRNPPTTGQQAMSSLGNNIGQMQGKPALPGLGGKPALAAPGAQMASPGSLMALPKPKPPGAVQVATSPAAAAASASLARPMKDLRQEAYNNAGNEGPMPAPQARFGEARPLLGNTTFKNLQPRRSGAPSGSPMDSGGATQSSYAGLAPFVDEQTAGAPRRISGFRGRRPGARFTEGPMRGKTLDQALLQSRDKYAGLSPEQKAAYESKARMQDISTEVPASPATAPAMAPAPAADPMTSIDPTETNPFRPRRPQKSAFQTFADQRQ